MAEVLREADQICLNVEFIAEVVSRILNDVSSALLVGGEKFLQSSVIPVYQSRRKFFCSYKVIKESSSLDSFKAILDDELN